MCHLLKPANTFKCDRLVDSWTDRQPTQKLSLCKTEEVNKEENNNEVKKMKGHSDDVNWEEIKLTRKAQRYEEQ